MAAARRMRTSRPADQGPEAGGAHAVSVQSLISGIRPDREETEATAERAEGIMPGDPEVLFTTWGQARVTASLFSDDIDRAVEQSVTGRRHAGDAALTAPRRAWGYYALLQAIAGPEGRSAIDQAQQAGAAIGWNPGLPRATPRRCSKAGTATGTARPSWPRKGKTRLAPFAPWWNHLARRLIARRPHSRTAGASRSAWLREATSRLRGDRAHPPGVGVPGHCCARRAPGYRVLAGARPRCPPRCAGSASPAGRWTCTCWSRSGFSNTEIAERLFISPKTVETHVASLISKTGQGGRRELVAHAARSARRLTAAGAGQSSSLTQEQRHR